MTSPTQQDLVLAMINDGELDDHLEAVIQAAKARSKAVPLKVGDTVKVSDNCAPKYMQGVLCTVTALTSKKQRGNKVYMCKPLDSEMRKLYGTRMVHVAYNGPGDMTESLKEISMARDLIQKVGEL